MSEPSESASASQADENESMGDVRHSFCKDWLEKQNSEGVMKLQLNKNDLQFIIQTNEGRQKFKQSADEDKASVPVGVGEPNVEPKAVKLNKLHREDVRMECGWQSCYQQVFEDYQEFQTHCRNHISDLQVTEEDDEIIYSCLWDSCKHRNSSYDELCRHMSYHAYHARLLGIGFNAQATLSLVPCKKDSSNRNKLPLLVSDYCCAWFGCQDKFKAVQAFLDHVKLHVFYAGPRYMCSWAGCGASFPRREVLKTHVRSHTGERLLACYHCGRHFACNRKITDHCRRQNVSSNSYSCKYCGLFYATEYLLSQHTSQHISAYACTLCDMSAPTLATLAQHVRYRHLPTQCRMHACTQCGHKSTTKYDLRKHMETHTRKKKRKDNDSDISVSDEEPRKKSSRKYACHICPETQTKVFTRGSRLTTHLVKVHGAQWPFGHSRFRYQISEDGMYRLTTTRIEVLEVSEKIVDGYSRPQDSLSNTFEYNLKQKADATPTTPTCFEISLKGNEVLKNEPKDDKSAVEITMCDVDEEGKIICSEVIKSDMFYRRLK